MIWTNKGLKQRVAELESQLTSAKEQISELISDKEYLVTTCNSQHEIIQNLRAEVFIGDVLKTSPNVVKPLAIPVKSKLTPGQAIARKLRGRKP